MKKYYPRLIDSILEEELSAFGGVLLTGPKWCGKTTTARQRSKSVLFMQDPDNQEAHLQLADIQPSILLKGEYPRLIDEWQMAPQLWDAVRHEIDMRGEEGLFILTGSVAVDENKILHSGAGRISRLKMYTMSLYESEQSTGDISLINLFDGQDEFSAQSKLTVEDYARQITRGGWPNVVDKGDEIALRQVAGYCDAIVKSDISSVDGVRRDEKRAVSILRSYARNVATETPTTTLLDDLLQNHESLHLNTLDSYLNALRRLYVIDDIQAWSPKLRSKTVIRTSDKRYFVDPAIAAYFLQARPADLLFDIRTYGFLFESLAIRDLRVYAQSLHGNLFHYRDKDGLEADAIIHLSDGRWAAIEVKLGSKMIDEAASNLLKLSAKIDEEKMRRPSFLMVITGTQYAYAREDGVFVVPLGCLKP